MDTYLNPGKSPWAMQMISDWCLAGTMTCKKRWTNSQQPQIGLKLSTAKTKLMWNNHITTINSDALEEVQNFTYLGSKITTHGDSVKDAMVRIRKASQSFTMLKPEL